jgi:hypothetical protein
MVPMLVLRWFVPLRLYAESNSSRRLAATILKSPEKDLPLVGFYYFRTSLPFYLRRRVGLVSKEWGEMTSNYQVVHQAAARRAGAGNPGEGLLVELREFCQLANSTSPATLVLLRNDQIGLLSSCARNLEPLWTEEDDSVWEIPPARARPSESRPSRVVAPFQP